MSEKRRTANLSGPYRPTLILHGGAGRILRPNLPPDLYEEYKASLLSYLTETRSLLYEGANALDAAVHAVSLMEDDPLFNCGRGSVFTEKGTIEMEASVMIASVRPDAAEATTEANGGIPPEAFQKRAAGVIHLTQTRHPIRLAQQVLVHTQDQVGGVSRHCQLAGKEIEETGFQEWGLERKDKDWFWTKKRWDEHIRGLKKTGEELDVESTLLSVDEDDGLGDGSRDLPSQGTVGCVVMDQWGTICAATSTGGLTNKKPGRIGDTPTVGAGFWAESWAEPVPSRPDTTRRTSRDLTSELYETFKTDLQNITSCIPFADRLFNLKQSSFNLAKQPSLHENQNLITKQPLISIPRPQSSQPRSKLLLLLPQTRRRRAIAISGTGNGDSFLRLAAARTVGALSRFQARPLSHSLPMVAGPLGELQQSAGDRWGTGEGEGGMIGIEVVEATHGGDGVGVGQGTGKIVWDFNCGGMWRAVWDEERDRGEVMVFRKEY